MPEKHSVDTDSNPLGLDSPHFKGKLNGHPDVLCFSHLRWDFVFQRPQHLLTRSAARQRVFFIEEPILESGAQAYMELKKRENGLHIIVPHLPEGLAGDTAETLQRSLLNGFLQEHDIKHFLIWYYTPMALGFTRHLQPIATVYDCMDELSAFKGAPKALGEREAELLRKADVVFTGGQSLYEHKKTAHHNIHPFPSSIDQAHFRKARRSKVEPDDQRDIPHPRIGFFGVIDERFDVELISAIASSRPDWHFVMIGPVVKIDPEMLPRNDNIHYLGGKKYEELPSYLAGWSVAILPFARNESTRFISPTKTPEYLAAGKPVVSTSIRDVVHPYGEQGLVRIADRPNDFIQSVERVLSEESVSTEWLKRVDSFLSNNSWDKTWADMMFLINQVISRRSYTPVKADYKFISAQKADTASA